MRADILQSIADAQKNSTASNSKAMADNLTTRLYRLVYDPEDDTEEVARSFWIRPTSLEFSAERVDEEAIRADAAAKERALVVAWLRNYGQLPSYGSDIAAAIELGEHNTEGENDNS